jgi:hypothetical protein
MKEEYSSMNSNQFKSIQILSNKITKNFIFQSLSSSEIRDIDFDNDLR